MINLDHRFKLKSTFRGSKSGAATWQQAHGIKKQGLSEVKYFLRVRGYNNLGSNRIGQELLYCYATPVLQAELNPNTHATMMIKYSSYSLKYGYKQQNSIIWLKKKKKIDRNWGSGGWKGQSVSWRKSSGLSEPHHVSIKAGFEEHKGHRISSCSKVSPKRWWRKYVPKALKADENACVAAIIIWNVYIWLVWFIWAFGSFHFNTNDWLFSLVRMFSAEG